MSDELRELLDELQVAPPPRARLYTLSNLSREEAEEVQAVWGDLPVETRHEVISTLVEIAESDFEVHFGAIFRLALEDSDPTVRQIAVEGLWEDEDVRLVPLLVARLREDHAPNVRAAAAASLGRFLLLGELGKIRPLPHQQVYQALLAACSATHEHIEVHRRSLESIAYSGEEEVTSLIHNAYQHADEGKRISAVFAMGRSADVQWASCVLEELYSVNPAMRYEAARACGELALKETLATLIELVEDVDSEVQEAAIWALGQIGGGEAQRVLEWCARTDNEATREAALEALHELEFLHGDLSALLFPLDLEEEEEEEEGEGEGEGEKEEDIPW